MCPTTSSFNNLPVFLETMSASFRLVFPSERSTKATFDTPTLIAEKYPSKTKNHFFTFQTPKKL